MLTRTFYPRQFLRSVYGTEPFAVYCHSRGISFEQVIGFPMKDDDFLRWREALGQLPETIQTRIALELAQVNEIGDSAGLSLLIAAGEDRARPPDDIPGTTAVALWFLVQHPDLFHEVFLRQEISEVDAWRIAHVPPGIVLTDLARKREMLAASLRKFFRVREGTGRFCAAEHYPLQDATCFIAYLSDRLHLFEIFTDGGEHATRIARPALPVLFVYNPHDGRVLLKARQRATDKVLALFQLFGKSVLGVPIHERSLAPAFRLDLFKRRFDPLLYGTDMVRARVKALVLGYPERWGRRRIKLETLAGDAQFAIYELLEAHGGREELVEQLTVLYVELEISLQDGGGMKNTLVRLWPDRCNLNQTALGQRLFACLQRWGIAYDQ
jgi:hypothetical protein